MEMKWKEIGILFFVVCFLMGLTVAGPLSVREIGGMKRAADIFGNDRRAAVVANLDENFTEKIKGEIPQTYELTAEKVNNATLRGKFLMWTRDGEHIMWGKYGNKHFVGKDNEGKKAWGIYGNGFFAGFYGGDGGEFFYGKYRGGHWRAYNLFDENISSGRYVLFPWRTPLLTAASE